MPKLSQLASYLVYSYENHTGARFGDNEMKLQSMLYFAQRECLAVVGAPLFEESFEGWYLSDLARREASWRNSRTAIPAEENKPKLLELADICEDAKKVRLYDTLFDVYLDELEEFEGEVLEP